MSHRRTRRLAGLALFVPLVCYLVLAAGHAVAAPAQTAPALGGYSVDTRSTGLRVGYDAPGSLAIGPVLDAGAPESQSRLATGPVGSSISSLAFPGSLILGLGPLLAAAGQEPPVPLPEYPLLVEASSGGTPEVRDETAAGSVMHALADQNVVEATTTMAGTGADEVLSFGGSESRTVGSATDVALGEARSSMSDIVAIAGLLRIDSVVTDLSASSDGASAGSSGGTVVAGATFAGQPITIGPDGVRFVEAPDADGPGGVLGGLGGVIDPVSALLVQILDQRGSLDEALADTGISIRLADPQVVEAGATAERRSEGLVIEFDQELGDTPLVTVFDLIPLLPDIPGAPLQPNDFVQLLQARQVAAVSLAPASVAVSASPPFDLPEFEINIPAPPTPQPSGSGGVAAGGGSAGASPAASPAAPSPAHAGNASPVTAPIAASPPTIPSELGLVGVILAMVGAWIMTAGSRRLPDWAIDGRTTLDACEPEDPEGEYR